MIIVDTGPLLAAADSGDDDHQACAALLERHAHELVVPASVVVEACWLIARTLGATAESELLTSIADGEVHAATHPAERAAHNQAARTQTARRYT